MLAKIFEALYPKVLINIVVKRASTLVYIELCSKKGTISSVHEEFDTVAVNEKMLQFIQTYIKESPYFYVSLLDRALVQGALPACSKQELRYYYDLSDCEYKCVENRWAYYTAKSEIYETEKIYKDIGVDFLFSPFAIINTFFKDKIEGKLAIYALIEENYISVAVFESGKLLYGEHLDMQSVSELDEVLLADEIHNDDDLDLDEGIDLESMDVEDDGIELEDFGDIEDLDTLEDIDEFDSKDVEEELLESENVLDEADEDDFNEDYQRFSLIQTSIANYYKDERYESQFLENMYISDGVGVSRELKRYLEEEMFLNVYIRHIEIDAEICELAKEELGL